jgi:hypothetical protein
MARTLLAQGLQQATARSPHSRAWPVPRDVLRLGGVVGLAMAVAAVPFPGRRGQAGPASADASPSWVAGWPGWLRLPPQAGWAVGDPLGGLGPRRRPQLDRRGVLAEEQLVERGGQFIDTSHKAI